MRVTSLLCCAALAGAAPLAAQQRLDSALVAAYRWRNIGPDRGGRSIAVSGVKGRPREAYFGAAGGGLWKTTDGGTNWSPVTDGQTRTASVGAVAVSESNPDVVFIGMGEACIRGNIIPGDGVYRSTDGGKSWTHVGFAESHAIAKIRIHPTDPQIVFVASFGKYSVPSAERGVFKSTDGGRSWRRVLYRDDKTGAVDIAIDRTNPNVIYAALWEAYRTEYQMSSGGPGSGLFKSTDGGETWTEITRNPGLPRGMVGRIGVAVSGANAKRVYALVENENGGLYRSEDAGATWALVNERRAIRQRAFYYTHVFADPKNADVVYMQNTTMFRSADGGKTMKSVNNGTHGDFHDLWIDPDDAAHLVVGNDGGGAVSIDTAQSWTEEDYPTEQFYHVITTAHVPYHLCGSQQDNSTLCVPFDWNVAAFAAPPDTSTNARRRDITQGGMREAYEAGGGEPGYIAPDPLNPDLFYSGTNNGAYVDRYDRRFGTSREVNPYPWFYSGEPAKDIRERWQWTFPIIFSKADPRTLYVSSQRLWRSRDGGKTWSALSGDLTRHDPKTLERSGGPITGDMNGPEVYGTIFAVGPGKRDVSVIWTGSDDGLVQVTRDGGTTWTNVTPRAMPDLGRVSQIDASAFDDGTAYVSVRRPLLNDFAPYIFKTADFGRTWTKIVTGIRADAYVHAVREDPTRRGLLYAATQHGVYLSFDDGATWQPLNPGLPDVPVADLVVQENELVIATHGRGFWVLDNIAPLRQATPERLGADGWLFTPPRAVRSGPGVTISWWLKTKPHTARLEILDSTGAVLRTWVPDTTPPERRDTAGRGAGGEGDGPGARTQWLPLAAGVSQLPWNLRTQPFVTFPGMIMWGVRSNAPALPPGRYAVRLTADGRTLTAPISVERNPWIADVTDADLQAQYAFSRQVRDRVNDANAAVIEIRRVRSQLEDRLKQSTDARLRAAADTLLAHARAVEERIYQVRNQSNQDPLNFPIKVNNRLANLMSMAERGDGPPTSNMPELFRILSEELQGYLDRLAQVWSRDLATVNAELARLALPKVDLTARAGPPSSANLGVNYVAAPVFQLNDNGAWSWFMDERAIIHEGKLIVGSVRSVGDYANDSASAWGNVEIAVRDLTSGVTQRTVLHRHLQQDDHDNPALLALPDGRYLAMYTQHGVERRIYYRFSEPHNPLAWGPALVFDTPGDSASPLRGNNVTYSNLFPLASGRIMNFFRGVDLDPNYMYSDDTGQTWRYGGRLAHGRDGYSPYLKYAFDGVGTIHFVMTEDHPRNYDNSVYHGFVRDGNVYLSGGTLRGKLSATADVRINAWDLTKVFQGDPDNVAWVIDLELDAQQRPYVVFSVQKDGRGRPRGQGGMDHRFDYGRWDGSAWRVHEIAYAGTRLYPGEDDYTGLAALDPKDPNVIYISTDADPVTGAPLVSSADGQRHRELFRGSTGDLGATWKWVPVTANSDADNLRPVVPKWRGPRTALAWMRGTYKNNHGEWTTAVVATILP